MLCGGRTEGGGSTFHQVGHHAKPSSSNMLSGVCASARLRSQVPTRYTVLVWPPEDIEDVNMTSLEAMSKKSYKSSLSPN